MVRPVTVLAGIVFLTSLGCTNNDPLVSVSGSVEVDGQPLSGANLSFDPQPGTSGPKITTAVFDGTYQIEESAGLQPGNYTVRITMIPRGILDNLPTDQLAKLPSPDAVVAKQFDTESELTATLDADDPNRCDFIVQFQKR